MSVSFQRIKDSPLIMTWFNYFVKFGGNLIILPIALKKFSPADFNVYMVFQTVFTLFLLTDMGFSQSISRLISYGISGIEDLKISKHGELEKKGTGTPNFSLINQIYHASKNVYLIISIVSILLLFFLGTEVLNKPISLSSEPKQYQILWFCTIPFIASVIYGNVFSSYLLGINKVALINRLDAYFNFGRVLTDILIILFRPDIVLLIINNRVWTNITVLRNYLLIKRQTTKFVSTSNYRYLYKTIFTTAWKSGLGILFGVGLTQGISLFVAQMDDSLLVASFLLSIKIIDVISNISKAPLYSKLPHLTILSAKSHLQQFKIELIKSLKLSYTIFSSSMVIVTFLFPFIINVIGSKTPPPDQSIWYLLVIAFFFERFSSMHMQILAIKNRIIWHYVNGTHLTIVIVLIFLFFNKYGLIVVPLSLLFSYTFILSWMSSFRNYKFVEVRWWKFELRTSVIPFIVLIISLIINGIIQ